MNAWWCVKIRRIWHWDITSGLNTSTKMPKMSYHHFSTNKIANVLCSAHTLCEKRHSNKSDKYIQIRNVLRCTYRSSISPPSNVYLPYTLKMMMIARMLVATLGLPKSRNDTRILWNAPHQSTWYWSIGSDSMRAIKPCIRIFTSRVLKKRFYLIFECWKISKYKMKTECE